MTVSYMKGLIGYEKYWLPMCEDIRVRNCVDPPPKHEIARELVATMRSMGIADANLTQQFLNTAREIEKQPPSAFWMLSLLSTMNPAHPYFGKAWEKPKVRASGASDVHLISNPGNFFSGLPLAKSSRKKGRGINFLDPQQQEVQRLQVLNARIAELQ